jgi:hypothetical protein
LQEIIISMYLLIINTNNYWDVDEEWLYYINLECIKIYLPKNILYVIIYSNLGIEKIKGMAMEVKLSIIIREGSNFPEYNFNL